MSSTEILRNKGRLAEAEMKEKHLRLRLEGLVTAMRDNLDPFAGAENLPLDVVAAEAMEAAELQIELKETLGTIAALKRALGR